MSQSASLSSWMGRDRFQSVSEWIKFKGKTVLDIGCNDCNLAKTLKLPDSNTVYGVDISPSSTDRRIKLKKCNLENGLPFRDAMFDVVIMLEVIEHLNNREFVLSEIHRVLKKGGRFIITTPNRNSVEGLISRFVIYFKGGKWNAWDKTHVHIYSQREFREFISNMFSIVDYKTSFFLLKRLDSVPGVVFKKVLRKLRMFSDRAFSRSRIMQRFGFNMMILCRK